MPASGIGAHLGKSFTQGSWSKKGATRSSNWRELKGMALSLKASGSSLSACSDTDNATAVAYINRQGGNKEQVAASTSHTSSMVTESRGFRCDCRKMGATRGGPVRLKRVPWFLNSFS